MSPPNGVYIVQGESSLVVTAMRRTSRWTSHSHQEDDGDPLLSSFSQLKDVLNSITDLSELESNVFLSPFLEVIRSEDTTGPITGLALTSVNKFLSYGFIDPTCESAAGAVENIADAVTHARFMGTDPSSDEVVLMKIICVLRTLILCSAGVLLTNESVCEIMQSCFRICFEMRLSELLRKSAEHTLMDMVQLLFTRLPQFREDPKWSASLKKLKMRAGTVDAGRMGKRKRSPKPRSKRNNGGGGEGGRGQAVGGEEAEARLQEAESLLEQCAPERIATTPVGDHSEGIIDITKSFQAASEAEAAQLSDAAQPLGEETLEQDESQPGETTEEQAESFAPAVETGIDTAMDSSTDRLAIPEDSLGMMKSSSETELAGEQDDNESVHSTADSVDTQSTQENEFVNPRGVRFLQQQQHREGSGPLIPYGLPSVRELFRFLVSLTNPLDRHNTDVMIHMGLSLLTVALESGADHIAHYNSLLCLVKDEMCRHLFMLLQTERLTLFAAAMRVCFLLFESMRSHLKFQLEMFLTRLSDLIVSESPRISYEVREIALESVVGLWRIPGLVTELYLNFDCDLYCANVFEDLTKLLSKNAFPVSGLFTTNLLSLDALLTVVDAIEQHCQSRILTATKTATPDPDRLPDSTAPEVRVGGEATQTLDTENAVDARLVGPPTSGYSMAQMLLRRDPPNPVSGGRADKPREVRKGPQIRPNRMKTSMKIPTPEELAAIKHKKKVYQSGTELFNVKPAKAVAYLQEQRLFSDPLNPNEVVVFLKENPKLDKKMIGEYISNRKNSLILEAFVKSFNFEDLRVDEALRLYLETFRLSGEAAVISYVMEHFAEHWHKSNGEPFANADVAFTLAYAIIMLNVDQHNHNVKKQSIPMTLAEFKRNLSKVNAGQDFEEDMLEEMYAAIRGEEIVMPSEHTGLIRENFLWKVLLRRGTTKDGVFQHAPTGAYDHELFTLIWGPTVAALSFVFDKSSDEAIIQKATSGFRKCAMISAHYGMSDVFDNLVISLCKFSTLLSSAESPESLPAMFGANLKAQLATRTVFTLAHRHGDILREGWKNILDCTLQLYRARLLPKAMIEVEDFVDLSGKISIIREDTKDSQRAESGVLSSFYSYFSLSESSAPKGPSAEEQEYTRRAQACVRDCHLKTLFEDSKFLREDSLQELVKSLIAACQEPGDQVSMSTVHDEDSAVFFLELLITVVLCNRDRVLPIWQGVRDFLYNTVVVAGESTFLVERAVVGLLRVAVRLLRREEVAPLVLSSLRILLLMKPSVLHSISRQVAFGLHELLRTNAANIHSGQDWVTLFTLLEVVGAGANPSPLMQVQTGVNVAEVLYDAGAQSDSELPSASPPSDLSDRGYTSDSELYEPHKPPTPKAPSPELQLRPIPDNGSWLLVSKEECPASSTPQPSLGVSLAVSSGAGGKRGSGGLVNQYSIDLAEELHFADSQALLKASETLAFLVRDAAHITPHNFESCVHAIRTFVEASLNGGRIKPHRPVEVKTHHRHHRGKKEHSRMKKAQSSPSQLTPQGHSDEEGEGEGEAASLHSLSIQLLDLMHTLHTRAAKIFESWAEEQPGASSQPPSDTPEAIDARTSAIWAKCWCPLLQGIARLCCDSRRLVRSQALTYLQRALLVHDLQTLSAVEWEACFNKVLFPLLTKLLDNICPQNPTGMEETRMRASTLLSKVFLQHLSPLLSLATFTALWLTILDFMEKYMHADHSDLLSEAIPESLKNMLLVMDTASIFQARDGNAESKLWRLTWDKIDTFLPHLKDELFAPVQPPPPEPQATCIERNETVPEAASGPAHPSSKSELPSASSYFADCNNCSAENASRVRDRPDAGDRYPPRPASPLMNQEEPAPSTTYILHPPLPATSTAIATPQPAGTEPGSSGGAEKPPMTLTTPRPLPIIHDV